MADYRIRILVDPSGAVAGSRTATTAVERIGQAADRVSNRSVGGLMEKLRSMGGVLQVAAAVAAVTAYTRVADRVTSMNAQLRLASRNQADLNRLQAASYQIAQRNGTAWDATGTLLAKTVKSARAMGLEMDRAMQLGTNATRAISAGIRVSGTSAAAASAGVFQLGQALASGVLRGDELNSVMENIPGVADALARALGVTTGQLRAMGREGELTSQKVIEGLEKAMPGLERLASLIPLTFSGAFQKVQNSAARLLSGLDSGGLGIGAVLMKGLDLASRSLDFLAEHVKTVSAVITGLLVAAAVKAAGTASAAGAAALLQAKANDQVARSAVASATAQLGQARASLAVTTAMEAQGVATAAQVRAQAAAVTASAGQLVQARAAATATGAQLAVAASRATLFGRAVATAAGVARAALAAVGGPIGLIVAAIAGLVLWAGKAALSFQPIAGEAGTVADYIAVAFEDATNWVAKKWGELTSWVGEKLSSIAQGVRSLAVLIVDNFLGAARGAAGAVGGIVAAWQAGISNIRGMLGGMAADAKAAMSGNFTTAGTTAAMASQKNLGTAFSQGFAAMSSSALRGVSGESVVAAVEALPGQIRQGISDAFANSGWRDRANQRAADRARAANTGGDAGPGSPVTAAGDEADKARAKAKETERTFQDIIDEAREAAHLASLTTNEAEKQSAIYSAQRDLKRELTASEQEQLRSVVQLRQQNEANLRLQEQIRDVAAEVFANRVKSRAEDARAAGDYSMAIQLEAELRVQELLNQAKRDGVALDQAKVEAYRQAVILAGRENEVLRLQEESRRALQSIADEARDSIRSAVSDGIYAALSGDIKGVGGFFKNLANIMRRQLAETITYNLFRRDQQAKVDQLRVTTQAIQITEPAAQAVREAGMGLVEAITGVANSIQPGVAAPVKDAGTAAAEAIAGAAPQLQEGVQAITDVFAGALGPLGSTISGIIRVLGSIFNIGGAGNSGGLLSRLFRSSSKSGDGTGSLGGLTGVLGKVGQGAMYGQLGGMLPGLFGAKGSSTGSMMGGVLGSLTPLGPLGGVIGGAIGSLVGGMLKKTKTGFATISSEGVSTGGNNAQMRASSTGAGNDIMTRLREAANALGGAVGSFGSITIGQRDGKWRVNETGTSLKTKKGAKDFGQDAAAALEYAFQTALKRGALTGLSTGIANAIQSGLATIEEAVDFTQVRKRISLEAIRMVDPVRAAVMEVDEEFATLKAQYEKFGESTADLEKVYFDRRQDAINQALKDQMGGIRDFIDELKGGALGGQSLTDRASYQNQLFSAIEAAQAAGQTIDYNELNSVGRALLSATRELEGATPAFYQQVDRVMSVLEAAIAAGENPNVSTLPPPIWSDPTAVTSPIVQAINDNTAALTAAMSAVGQAVVRGNTAVVEGIENMDLANPSAGAYYWATRNF